MSRHFDPDVLHEIACAHLGKPLPAMLDDIQADLAARHPGRIASGREWVLSNAGGVMGTFALLHASLSEYGLFYGSPIGSSGHTGRYHFVEDWATVLDGEMWYYAEGSIEREVYGPGDRLRLARGEVKGYRIPDHAWILEYARGPIPLMLPFGLADTVFSTLDWRTAVKTLRVYGSHVLRSLGG